MILRDDLYYRLNYLVQNAKFSFWPADGVDAKKGQPLDGWLVAWSEENPVPLPTLAEILAVPALAIDLPNFEVQGTYLLAKHLDNVANERRYDSAISCASYATSTNAQWKAEAVAFIDWRDSVFLYVLNQIGLMASSERTVPTFEEFQLELPVIVWP